MQKSRDEKRFMELLFRQNYNRIYEYCLWKLGPPPQDAEDCAMEVFLRAFHKAADLVSHPCPERWLYVTARNVSMELLKKRKKQRHMELAGDTAMEAGERMAGDSLCPERETELEAFLTASLTPKEQELYRLMVKDRQDAAQIAEQLSISYTNATTRVYRLRRKLKKQLEREGIHGKKSR